MLTMTKRLIVALFLAAWAASAAGASTTEYPPVDVPFEAQRVPDSDTYYVLGIPAVPDQENAGFTSNAGFVVTREGVVVFDALGTPSLGAALLDAVRSVTDKPVKFVVASHYHADHIYGLQVFKERTDAKIVAQERAQLYVNSQDKDKRLAQRREALSPWVDERTRVVPPDITFTDEYDFSLGGKHFTLVYAGPAHAPDDTMMMVEPRGVLFAGDIVQNHRIPSLDSPEVNTANWVEGLKRVRELDPQFVVPGHGNPHEDAIAAIDFTLGYLNYVREVMGNAVRDWVDFSQAYEQADWSKYEDLPAFAATNEANAYRVYLEMERKQLE